MATTAMALGCLLTTNADIAFLTQQQIYWSQKYEANEEKLTAQQKYCEKWDSSYDAALNNERTLTYGSGVVAENNTVEAIAINYANYKVSNYNAELYQELSDLDIEYDTMKCLYEAALETKRALQESEKSLVQSDAQDNCMLGGS